MMNSTNQSQPPLLQVKHFSLSFKAYGKGFKEKKIDVAKNINVTVHEGEIVAIVGASGSGKTILANAILGILPKHASWQGEIFFKGKKMSNATLKKLRGTEITLIPQSVQSLNPVMKVGKQVQEAVQTGNKQEVQREIFSRIGLSEKNENQYPFELSGGMARRVLVATAIVSNASLIIADEPTPGLDPMILKETSGTLKELAEKGKGILFISHDIRTALSIADRVVVFDDGETIDEARADQFVGNGDKLTHPYTKKLWNALPENKFFPISDYKLLEKQDVHSDFEEEKLVAHRVSYRYGDQAYLFRHLSLEIARGEIVGMHGYSGSGKTTLAKILAGYIMPHEGTVHIEGYTSGDSAVNPVQLVWQHPERAVNPKWKMEKVLKESNMENSPLLHMLGIKDEWLYRYPSELSGGELQRICLARALSNETKFLIADEMTTMLDAITQAELWQVIYRLVKERNIGVLAISHDHELLHRISDRIYNFQDISHVPWTFASSF